MVGAVVGTGRAMSASLANSYRVAAVAERLGGHVRAGNDGNPAELFGLCLSLARGIDYAVANNEVPARVEELPFLLKQICQCKKDLFVQAAIMVLMISVKNACKLGWFSEASEELFRIANEVGDSFCSPGEVNSLSVDSFSLIPTFMMRFYPLMKMGHILASLEIKPGYEAYLTDFHISKNLGRSPHEKIRLFVVQTDKTETSACITSPQQVNFLLNGKGVEKRTNLAMDTGPQIPTNVTAMLKYGTNLLQAVGQFNGHYIVVIAFMSMTSIPENPVLADYMQSGVPAVDPDSDIIEGPSRISINCPISYSRIRIPVKGQSCKHLQCFDFRNFVDINSRRPSWRCPHCNQPCCYTDIRVDQNMAKVLEEVGENINGVIISADGSWKAVLESDDNVDQTHERTVDLQNEQPKKQESMPPLTNTPMVLDLTRDDDIMEFIDLDDVEDRKPSQFVLQSQPVSMNGMVPSQFNNADDIIQHAANLTDDNFWSNIFSLASSVRLGIPNMSATPPACISTTPVITDAGSFASNIRSGVSSMSSAIPSPMITDAISPSLNRDVGIHRNIDLTSVMQNQVPPPANLQIQQPQPVHPAASNEYGRLLHLNRHINRTPVAVQALPVQSPTPNLQQWARTTLDAATSGGSSFASRGAVSTGSAANGQHQLPRSLVNPNQIRLHIPDQSTHQQVAGIGDPNQCPAAGAAPSGLASDFHHLRQQVLRVPQSRSQASGATQSSLPIPHIQTWQGVVEVGVGITTGTPNSQRPELVSTAQRPPQMARQPSYVPVQTPSVLNSMNIRTPSTEQSRSDGGAAQLASDAGSPGNLPSEQNWRPTGRMRGSVTGRAFESLRDLMIQPFQPGQVPRPPSNLSSSRPVAPPHLQAFINRNAQLPSAQNSPTTEPASSHGVSGILP